MLELRKRDVAVVGEVSCHTSKKGQSCLDTTTDSLSTSCDEKARLWLLVLSREPLLLAFCYTTDLRLLFFIKCPMVSCNSEKAQTGGAISLAGAGACQLHPDGFGRELEINSV